MVLHLAASNDLLAKWFDVPVDTITWIYRVLVFVLPLLFGYVTYRLMKALNYSGVDRFREMPLSALKLRGPSSATR